MSDVQELYAGRITSLKAQVKTPGRVSVFIEDKFAFGVNQDVVLEFGLTKGLDLTTEAQREILEREDQLRARSTALNFLSYRDRSEQEIRRRLQRSEYSVDAIDGTIEYLREAGLLDDENFATSYAEGRFRSGGYGPVRVLHDLRRKGVDRTTAGRVVDDVFSDEDELFATARDLGRRRWDRLSREEDHRKRRRKVYDYLVRRGFPYGVVLSILDELKQ